MAGKPSAPVATAGREAFPAHLTRQLHELGVGSLECGDRDRTR